MLQIDLVKGMMDCLYAECKPCITDCVLAELEKLGQKYRVALKVAKVRLYCSVLSTMVHILISAGQGCSYNLVQAAYPQNFGLMLPSTAKSFSMHIAKSGNRSAQVEILFEGVEEQPKAPVTCRQFAQAPTPQPPFLEVAIAVAYMYSWCPEKFVLDCRTLG